MIKNFYLFGHDAIKHDIEWAIKRNNFPPVVLISGASCSGKNIVAREIYRYYVCQYRTQSSFSTDFCIDSSCECDQCSAVKNLRSPYLLLVGAKSLLAYIMQFTQWFLEQNHAQVHASLDDAINQLLLRFSPILWDDINQKKCASAVELLGQAREELHEPFLKDTRKKKCIEAIITSCKQLTKQLPLSGVSIDMLRRIIAWTHMSSPQMQGVIIEHVDSITNASANILLKTLEEPPPNTQFILTCTNTQAVLPTIRSRTRIYQMEHRAVQSEIAGMLQLWDYTAQQGFYETLLNHHDSKKNVGIIQEAQQFMQLLENGEMLVETHKITVDRDDLEIFIYHLILLLRNYLYSDMQKWQSLDAIHWIHAITRIIQREYQTCCTYNTSVFNCLSLISYYANQISTI